jgi:hypothetical protein
MHRTPPELFVACVVSSYHNIPQPVVAADHLLSHIDLVRSICDFGPNGYTMRLAPGLTFDSIDFTFYIKVTLPPNRHPYPDFLLASLPPEIFFLSAIIIRE